MKHAGPLHFDGLFYIEDFFSLIFNQLKTQGTPIPTNDIWIAASAMRHGLTLATFDNHFSKIAGLNLQIGLSEVRS